MRRLFWTKSSRPCLIGAGAYPSRPGAVKPETMDAGAANDRDSPRIPAAAAGIRGSRGLSTIIGNRPFATRNTKHIYWRCTSSLSIRRTQTVVMSLVAPSARAASGLPRKQGLLHKSAFAGAKAAACRLSLRESCGRAVPTGTDAARPRRLEARQVRLTMFLWPSHPRLGVCGKATPPRAAVPQLPSPVYGRGAGGEGGSHRTLVPQRPPSTCQRPIGGRRRMRHRTPVHAAAYPVARRGSSQGTEPPGLGTGTRSRVQRGNGQETSLISAPATHARARPCNR